MSKTIFFIVLTMLYIKASAQPKQVSFEELDSLQKVEPRLALIFVHADWCKFCQQMKHTVFTEDSIVGMLDKNFYFLSLDGETEEDIVFNKTTFHFKPTGNHTGVHELAEALVAVKEGVSYPSVCILNKSNEIVFQYNQALSSEEVVAILNEVMKKG